MYYAINTDDPINFNSSSSDAIMVDAADFTSITVTTIPPSSNITVVVVASNSTGVILESSPPVTRQTFGTFEDGKHAVCQSMHNVYNTVERCGMASNS